MPEWYTIPADEVVLRLGEAIQSAVEMISDYGRECPDWDRVIDSVECSQPNLDLGGDMRSPVIKAVLKEARRVYREIRDDNS